MQSVDRKLKVRNMMSPQMNVVPNQFVIETSKGKAFQSYKTLIAEYREETGKLYIYYDWACSRTTMKYFKEFVNSETPFLFINKRMFEDEINENDKIVMSYQKEDLTKWSLDLRQ